MIKIESNLSRGAIAGFAGGFVLALWLSLVDAGRGEPFGTVAFLASAMAGQDGVEASIPLIGIYTLLHFGLFVLVGILTTWLLELLTCSPNMLFGFALGFLLFDAVFYTGLTVSGVGIVEALGWPVVLAGNLLAGLVLTGVLRALDPEPAASIFDTLWHNRVLREGVVAGLLGAFTVAAWFLILDSVRGQPLFTPAALGSALFLGAADSSQVVISLPTVLGYSAVHFGGFLTAGTVVSGLIAQAEESPPVLLLGLLIFTSFAAFLLGLLAMFAEWILGALAWWNIAAGNLLATAAMGIYLLRVRPKLRATLQAELAVEPP